MSAIIISVDVVIPIIGMLIVGVYSFYRSINQSSECPPLIPIHCEPTVKDITRPNSCCCVDVGIADWFIIVYTETQRLIISEGILSFWCIGIQDHSATLRFPLSIDGDVRIAHALSIKVKGNNTFLILEPTNESISISPISRHVRCVVAKAGFIIDIIFCFFLTACGLIALRNINQFMLIGCITYEDAFMILYFS